jgi:K+-sensing histidine kinase KdpD
MSLKSKITAKLKAKATAVGAANLSNVRINGLADKLDAIVTNEDDIDGEIDKLDQLFSFKEMASLDDAKRNAESKAGEEEDAAKAAQAKKEADEKAAAEEAAGKTGDEMPSWFKAHLEDQNKRFDGLSSSIAAIQKGSVAQTRRQQLEAKLDKAPERFKTRTLRDFDILKLDSDDDFNNYLANIEQDVADEIQAASDAGLGADAPSLSGRGGKLKDDEVSPAMKEIINQREADAKAKAGAQ